MSARWPTADLKRITRRLRQHAPAGSVEVRRHRAGSRGGNLGLAWVRGDGVAVVSISDALPAEAAIDTLVHEWGHVLVWRRYRYEVEDHGPEWGACMAEAYTASRRDT